MKKEAFLSVDASKKLIGIALASRSDTLNTAEEHTVVIIKGTTNTCLAEALCHRLGLKGFNPHGFYRGIIKPAEGKAVWPVQKNDLVIVKGKILPDEDIYSIAGKLGREDIIFKGANALNMEENTCAVLIGNPKYGTMAPITEAAVGKRTRLIHPVGLEKRVYKPLNDLVKTVNAPDGEGLRLAVSPGIPYTEIDAFKDLFQLHAELIAAGGVGGYEGGCLFELEGNEENLQKAESFARENRKPVPYEL